MAVTVVALLGVWAVAEAYFAWWTFDGLGGMDLFAKDGDTPAFDDLADAESPFALVVFAILATGVAFVVWLFRVRANAEALSWRVQRNGRLWLVIGWLVPIGNWFIPKQIVDDVWLASRPAGAAASRKEHRPVLVYLWWACYLLYFWGVRLVEHAIERRYRGEVAPGRVSALMDLVQAPFGFAAAALAVAVVWRVSGFQKWGLAVPDASASSESADSPASVA
ncbi:DUF4328 domain-containing protein [Sphaerisporangium fuscum]|uniref:DUF4328 domain-containing protein n=1 Tax=Sphaerisporangium fuscum TaxID=2835868 RepID=UPI001BDD1B0F|nr:DUF4328 domain-containing protein [Sphaerisporangium fuscum]